MMIHESRLFGDSFDDAVPTPVLRPKPALTEQKVAVLVEDWRKYLAIYEHPRDLIGIADQAEFIRAAATKAKLSRDTLNEIGAVLWDIVRKAGALSALIEHKSGRRWITRHDAGLSTAKDLGYRNSHQRKRWELCAAVPDIGVDQLRDKILASNEGILTLAPLIAAGKQLQREQFAAERALEPGGTVDDLWALVEAGRKFGVIYADPPWTFRVYSGKGKSRSAERHYKADETTGESTMSIEQLKQLPIEKLAADDCALLLWSVWPELPGALELIQAWGFTYKTAGFLLVKTNANDEGLHWGMGYWTRANSEPCLLATRGAPQRLAKDVHQIVFAPASKHSEKPVEVHGRIERLVAGPYLELFAREQVPGWTVWGNEIARGERDESEHMGVREEV